MWTPVSRELGAVESSVVETMSSGDAEATAESMGFLSLAAPIFRSD